MRSDEALLSQRMEMPLLAPLQKVEKLFRAGRVEVRCYTAQKFHAKAYLCDRPAIYPKTLGILGSGNFTRPGLLQNIELNVHLTLEQTEHLAVWFEERWNEYAQDIDYNKLKNDKDTLRQLESLPNGAFGVWGSGPEPGLFALFTMEPTANASKNDEAQFAAVIGKPVLAFASRTGRISCDAGVILNMLRDTRPGEKSVTPSDEENLKRRIKEIQNEIREQFSHIGLPATILPKLICWMEIR